MNFQAKMFNEKMNSIGSGYGIKKHKGGEFSTKKGVENFFRLSFDLYNVYGTGQNLLLGTRAGTIDRAGKNFSFEKKGCFFERN